MTPAESIAVASRHLDSAARSIAVGHRELAALDMSLAVQAIAQALAAMVGR
jgi:hypothetical protein